METLPVLLQAVTEQIPASGYVLCFLPLAIVIVGFIIAARFTNLRATSTYQRLPMGDEPPAETH
jgi:Flp pilus assembly protein TadB